MEIKKTKNGNELIFAIQGRLDTTTAPQFEAELKQNIDGVEMLILDLVDLEYLSSAGLRVLLTAQKIMNKQGEMIVRNANETISEIFEVTGFSDILTIAATNTAGINNTIIITILPFSTPFLNTTGITIENNIAKMHGTTIEVAMISFIFISDCKI